MDKLSLDLEDLEVQSFETESTLGEKGTVLGQYMDCTTDCPGTTVSEYTDDDTTECMNYCTKPSYCG